MLKISFVGIGVLKYIKQRSYSMPRNDAISFFTSRKRINLIQNTSDGSAQNIDHESTDGGYLGSHSSIFYTQYRAIRISSQNPLIMPNYHISFWNLENLFDIEGSPRRSEKLERAIGADLRGWTQALLDQKIVQLSSIIRQLNGANGPDILGVCEVENEHVMSLLAQSLSPLNRNYQVVHSDTQDQRGIDVAFIYDANLFTVEMRLVDSVLVPMIFNHFVMRRTATRDILQVNFLTAHSNGTQRLVLICNHWPSRSGGQFESEGYRQIAGETLSYFHQRIREEHGDDTPVLAMGDFNDEPYNNSVTRHGLSLRSRSKVVRGIIPYFLNLMWPLMDEGVGSFYFDNLPNMLDQFLANENLLKTTTPVSVVPASVRINNFPEMVGTGVYPTPVIYGGMGKPVNQNGFSDHYPISVTVHEV